ERIDQCEEDRLFIGEVKVESALRAIRGTHDVFDARAVVALLGEHRLSGVEQTLACRVLVPCRVAALPCWVAWTPSCRIVAVHWVASADTSSSTNRRAGLLEIVGSSPGSVKPQHGHARH